MQDSDPISQFHITNETVTEKPHEPEDVKLQEVLEVKEKQQEPQEKEKKAEAI